MTDFVVERADPVTASPPSYVEWAAILAGAVAAVSISFVLLAFGSAIGFSIVSPWSMTPTASKMIWGGVVWFLLVQIWAFSLGGYIAGRLRHRWAGADQTEVEFRDGAHGLLVWATAMVFSVVVASSAIRQAVPAGPDVANPILATSLDRLFRASLPSVAPAAQPTMSLAETRLEAGRLLLAAHDTGLIAGDRTYLSQLVVARAGLPAVDAEARVVTISEQLNARLDTARKVGVLLGFLAAASLLVAAASAWWAATVGGSHRDAGKIWDGFASNQRLSFGERTVVRSARL